MSLVELWHFSQQLLQSQVSLFGFPAGKKKMQAENSSC